jgi:hypothetical protein
MIAKTCVEMSNVEKPFVHYNIKEETACFALKGK